MSSRRYDDARKSALAADKETPGHAVSRQLNNWRVGDARPDANPSPLEDEGRLSMQEQGDTLIVSGDIDLHQAQEFRDRAERFIRANDQPRLDLAQVPFLDSAGLATLLALSRLAKAEDKALRIVVTGSPRRVLKITGIDRVLVLEE